jgi:hypothetical protein
MKSKKIIFILLLFCGLVFAYTTNKLDFSLILKGENLKELLMPLSFLANTVVLYYLYIDKIKEASKNKNN